MSTCKTPPAFLEFTLTFDDRAWTAVSDLGQSRPKDRHYEVRVSEDGRVEIAFGDGRHGRRPPEGRVLQLVYRRRDHYQGVWSQQGRVDLDADWNEPSASQKTVCGLYRGTVVNNEDPEGRSRLQVSIPELFDAPAWAMPCQSPCCNELPDVDRQVWLAFEAGDPERPVWLGIAG